MAAIFFDIDGTIWDIKNVIPESTVQAVKMLQENGHLTFLCSGRMPSMIRDERLTALEMDGIVAGCGTCIEFHGEEIFSQRMEPGQIERTVRRLWEYGYAVMIEGENDIYMDAGIREDPYGKFLMGQLKEHAVSLEDAWGTWNGGKYSVLFQGQPYEEAVAELSKEYDVLRHGDIVMELVPFGNSKATGIRKVCELLDLPHEETYAIGDSVNDLEMLRCAAHGIAMGNGTDAAKAAADYITDDLHSDGVYKAMKHFHLI